MWSQRISLTEKSGGVPAKFITTMEKYSQKILTVNEGYPWYGIPGADTIEARQKFFYKKDNNKDYLDIE